MNRLPVGLAARNVHCCIATWPGPGSSANVVYVYQSSASALIRVDRKVLTTRKAWEVRSRAITHGQTTVEQVSTRVTR